MRHLYTPQTALLNLASRSALKWNLVFDKIASGIGGVDLELAPEWYESYCTWYRQQALDWPNKLIARLEDYYGRLTMLNIYLRINASALAKNELDEESDAQLISQQLDDFTNMEESIRTGFPCPVNSLLKSSNLTTPAQDKDSNLIYTGELFPLNGLLFWNWGLQLSFVLPLLVIRPDKRLELWPKAKELVDNICNMFESLEHYEPETMRWSCMSMTTASISPTTDTKCGISRRLRKLPARHETARKGIRNVTESRVT